MNPDEILQEIERQNTFETDLGVTFLFDYEKGDFVTENGSPVEVTDIEAVKAWITKLLKTEQNKYVAYEVTENEEYSYGTRLHQIAISYAATDYKKAEIIRELEEKITMHPRIDSLMSFTFEQEDEHMTISFRVNLIDGESFEQEVSV